MKRLSRDEDDEAEERPTKSPRLDPKPLEAASPSPLRDRSVHVIEAALASAHRQFIDSKVKVTEDEVEYRLPIVSHSRRSSFPLPERAATRTSAPQSAMWGTAAPWTWTSPSSALASGTEESKEGFNKASQSSVPDEKVRMFGVTGVSATGLAQHLENLVFSMTTGPSRPWQPASSCVKTVNGREPCYAPSIRSLVFHLRGTTLVAHALATGKLSAERLCRAVCDGAVMEMLQELQDEAEAECMPVYGQVSSFFRLHPVLPHIFQFLEARDFCRLTATCRSFSRISRANRYWSRFVSRDFKPPDTRQLVPRPPRQLLPAMDTHRRPEEISWRDTYRRLHQAFARWARWSEQSTRHACDACGEFGLARHAQVGMRVFHYSVCESCQAVRILAATSGDCHMWAGAFV